MMIFRRLGLLNKNQRGFTLIEILIVLAISGFVTGTTTMTIFQVLDGNVRTNNHMDAISRVQDAGYQVSTDVEMSQTVVRTADGDGFPLTLTWTDWENNDQYQVIYSITNNKLQRQYYKNGNLIGTPYVFEYILNTDPDTGELKTYCTLIDDTLSCTLTAIVGSGSQKQTETRVYEVIPRPKI
jgi:prepilin-type N-terminal cleavage/methylation domain-containing protein